MENITAINNRDTAPVTINACPFCPSKGISLDKLINSALTSKETIKGNARLK